jgi:hypothetical protein
MAYCSNEEFGRGRMRSSIVLEPQDEELILRKLIELDRKKLPSVSRSQLDNAIFGAITRGEITVPLFNSIQTVLRRHDLSPMPLPAELPSLNFQHEPASQQRTRLGALFAMLYAEITGQDGVARAAEIARDRERRITKWRERERQRELDQMNDYVDDFFV